MRKNKSMLKKKGSMVILKQLFPSGIKEEDVLYVWDTSDCPTSTDKIDDKVIDILEPGSIGFVLDRSKTRFIAKDWRFAVKIITHNKKIGWIGEGWVTYVPTT